MASLCYLNISAAGISDTRLYQGVGAMYHLLQAKHATRTAMFPLQKQASRTAKLTNILLLVSVLVLGFVSFLASLELLLTIGAFVIFQGIDSEMRQYYSLVTLRNGWLIAGAIILVSLIVGCSYNFGRRLGERGTLRWLLRILALEVVIIGLTFLVTGRVI